MQANANCKQMFFIAIYCLLFCGNFQQFCNLSSILCNYQPRVPESERTTVNHSETKKVKRAGKPTVDEVTQENRQPPPKPPRKAKLSVEDVVYDAPMENDIQKPVPEDDLYAPIEGNGQSEGKKDGSRKRYKNDGACFDEFGSYEKASVQDSLGKYDDCPGNEDIATKRKKQSRKVDHFPLSMKPFYTFV